MCTSLAAGPVMTTDAADSAELAKWRAYPQTILEFPASPPLRVDLRAPVRRGTREALARLGLDAPFAVFTPENPEGKNAEDAPTQTDAIARREANEKRRQALALELALGEVRWQAVDGVAPDGSYREHCVAARLGREEARERAARLRQLAWFWWDGESFWLMSGTAGQEPLRLGAESD